MQLIEQNQHTGAPLQARSLAQLLHSTLGISVHPRSIERAMARKKNGEPHARTPMLPHGCKDFYETLRAAVLCGQACVKDMGAIIFHGLWQGLAVLIAAPQPSPSVHRRPELPPTASAAVHEARPAARRAIPGRSFRGTWGNAGCGR